MSFQVMYMYFTVEYMRFFLVAFYLVVKMSLNLRRENLPFK